MIKYFTFAPTVLTTLPIRTASQGESINSNSFKLNNNTPSMPLYDAHLEGLFFLGV